MWVFKDAFEMYRIMLTVVQGIKQQNLYQFFDQVPVSSIKTQCIINFFNNTKQMLTTESFEFKLNDTKNSSVEMIFVS